MATASENETITRYTLYIGVGESVSLKEIGLTEDALKSYYSVSESEHLSVNSENSIITGKSKGEATVTLYHAQSGSAKKQPYAAVKVYISESDTYISPSLNFTEKLFMVSSDKSKAIKLISNNICSLEDILQNWDRCQARKEAAAMIGISEYEIDLYFKQAALWQVPKMTKEFAYLAALVGIRNARDLSKVDANNLEEAFHLLEYNVRITYNNFEMPDCLTINELIQNARSINERYSDYYDIEGGLPSMPSNLLDNDSFLQSDSDVINEGLKFLENIDPALPLPKTISGCIKINDSYDSAGTIPKGQGELVVSISGITEPLQGRIESDKTYSCVTDPQGKFTIVMPDKYNMHETITISVSKKNDMRYAVAGQSSSNKVEFVKRASEILKNEYITVTINDENGDFKEETKKASEILTVINKIRTNNSKAMEIEKVLRKRAYNKYALKEKFADAQIAKGKLESCKTVVERGVRYHIKNFYEQVNGLFESFDVYRSDDYFVNDEVIPEEPIEETVDEFQNENMAEADSYNVSNDAVVMEIETVKVRPGKKAVLHIYFRNPNNIKFSISDMKFKINNSESLSYVSCVNGTSFEETVARKGVKMVFEKQEQQLVGLMKGFVFDDEKKLFTYVGGEFIDNTTLVAITFDVPENCPDGTYSVEFDKANFIVHDEDSNDITDKVHLINGGIIVNNEIKRKPGFTTSREEFTVLPSYKVFVQVVPDNSIEDELSKYIDEKELKYQWYKDDLAIDGASESFLITDNQGEYYCIVSYSTNSAEQGIINHEYVTNIAVVKPARNEKLEIKKTRQKSSAYFKLSGEKFTLMPSQTVKIQIIPNRTLLQQIADGALSKPRMYSGRINTRIKEGQKIVNKDIIAYHWYKDDVLIEGATGNSYTVDSAGEYYCKIKFRVSGVSQTIQCTTNKAVVTIAENGISDNSDISDNIDNSEYLDETAYIISEEIAETVRICFAEKLQEIHDKLKTLEEKWNSLPQNEAFIYLYTLLGHEHIGNGFVNGNDPYESIGRELFKYFENILNDLYGLQSNIRKYFYNNDFVSELITENQIEITEDNIGGYIDLPDCNLLNEKIDDYKRAKAEYDEAQKEYERVCTNVEYSDAAAQEDEWFEKYISQTEENIDNEDYIVEKKKIDYIDDLSIDYDYDGEQKISFSEWTKEFTPKSPDDIAAIKLDADEDALIKQYKELMDKCLDMLSEISELENILSFNPKKYENDRRMPVANDSENSQNTTSKMIERCILNFLSLPMDSKFSESAFVINKNDFENDQLHPRALPSVKLMGDGENEIYLPTDTAPSRMFNYTMVNRLVEPKIRKNGRNVERSKLSGAIDVQEFRENLRDNHNKITVADSLGIGYSLNMHQAWIPDGFALGDLLYSLILAPGEEQRIIVREHSEAYNISDESSASDYVHDVYSNYQVDNETAAFTNAAGRFSSAHSDSSYFSKATSSGNSSIGILQGLRSSVSSTSTNRGSSSANAYQSDSYDEASHAAQDFQTSIKTESERISSAKRIGISIASSDESESVSSKIIANHNHSHVMTVQYWEVAKRYRLETCIDGVELLLFVPLKLISFMPDKAKERINRKIRDEIFNYNLSLSTSQFDQNDFEARYSNILRYYDIIDNFIPNRYRGGLDIIRKYASMPEWIYVPYCEQEDKFSINIKGGFLSCDSLSAEIYFDNGYGPVRGEIVYQEYINLDPSLNTREDVIYGIKQIRKGLYASIGNKKVGSRYKIKYLLGFIPINMPNNPHSTIDENKEDIKSANVQFEFVIPDGYTQNNISHIIIHNNVKSWSQRLSQNTCYMEEYEAKAIEKYEECLFEFSQDNNDNTNDKKRINHYFETLPECYRTPDVTFSAYEMSSYGDINISVEIGSESPKFYNLGNSGARVNLGKRKPVLTYKELEKMEDTFHHILSDTMYYSQAVWASLSDDERIMLLEPYTIEFENLDKIASPESGVVNSEKGKTISLLNCVNAKNVIGFYGNCMMLPFTFPPELVELLGKTAGDIQDELYRHHSCNFRVPSTVISVPTNGMVGEAVLGATNVSEKIDITRFWNWKDSDIDHFNLDQSSLNGRSLLENAQTKYVDAPTVGVTPTEHISANDLASALVARQQPTFADVYTTTDMRDVIKNSDNNASAGREQAMKSTTELTKAALEAAVKAGTFAATGGASGITDAVSGLTGGSSGVAGAISALTGAGNDGDTNSISSLLGGLGDAGLGNSDLGKLMKLGLGKNGSMSNVIQTITDMIGSGDSDQMKKNLSSIGGEDLKKFLTKFVSNSSSEEYKKLEDNFTNSISGLVKNPGKIKTEDIINAAKKFCSENNIELSEVTGYLGSKLGLY